MAAEDFKPDRGPPLHILAVCGSLNEKSITKMALSFALKGADGIVFGTPEYHGSMSGTLKNMFDLMSQEQLEGKIVGLVGVAGGHTRTINSGKDCRPGDVAS